MDKTAVEATLRGVIDPELGVNIVDLGLVYGIEPVEGGGLRIVMTMTTPACPLGDYLEEEVQRAVFRALPELAPVQVALVFDPPWRPDMMSEEGKRQLGWHE